MFDGWMGLCVGMGGKMGGVGREGVSVGGGVSGEWYRVLTLVLAGCVWVCVRLGVVAHFRLVPDGSLEVGGSCVWGGMQSMGVWWSSMVISFE